MTNVPAIVAALTATSAALNTAANLRLPTTPINPAVVRHRALKKIKKTTISSTLKESFDNAYNKMLERIAKEDQALTPQQKAAIPKAEHYLYSEVSGDVYYYENGKTREARMAEDNYPYYQKTICRYDRTGNEIERTEEYSDELTKICRTRKTVYYKNSNQPAFVYINDETGERCQHFDRDGHEDTKSFLTKQILKNKIRSKIDQKYAKAKGKPDDYKPVLSNKKLAILRASMKARFQKD